MKVIILTSGASVPKTGGVRFHMEVYQYLERTGAAVAVIDFEGMSAWLRRLPLLLQLGMSNLWLLIQFFRVARGGRQDIVLFEDFGYHPRLVLFNVVIKRLVPCKIVILAQDWDLYSHPILRWSWIRKLDGLAVKLFFQQASRVVAVSEAIRRVILALGLKQDNEIEAVYVGCDHERFHGASGTWERSYADQQKPHRLLLVGGFGASKGIEYLLEAMSLLDRYELSLSIAGDPNDDPAYCQQLQGIIGELGLEGRVVFHGFIEDKDRLSELYREAEIFVLPSVREGLPIVLLEAMSFGLPIVATTAGGIPELVKNGETGVLVPPRDPRALADAIGRLIESPALRERYGRNGQRFVQEMRQTYSWDQVASKVYAVMQASLER